MFRAKMAHAVEDRFYVLRLAPSTYPTNGFEDSDICVWNVKQITNVKKILKTNEDSKCKSIAYKIQYNTKDYCAHD